ncbi:MAG: hypothetical protein ABI655_12365, partial [Phenylobacterium sp.]
MRPRRPVGLLARVVRRSWRDNLLLAEALMALAGAATLLALAPFPRVARIMDGGPSGSPPPEETRHAL